MFPRNRKLSQQNLWFYSNWMYMYCFFCLILRGSSWECPVWHSNIVFPLLWHWRPLQYADLSAYWLHCYSGLCVPSRLWNTTLSEIPARTNRFTESPFYYSLTLRDGATVANTNPNTAETIHHSLPSVWQHRPHAAKLKGLRLVFNSSKYSGWHLETIQTTSY
jgi:hypothetical protein